jgi:hypothetical protein
MERKAILFAIVSIFISYGSIGQHQKYDWFPFQWVGDSVANQYFDKAAIFVSIQVNHLKGNTVAQFDLGSNATMLYGNAIKNYFGSRAALLAMTDTSTKATNESGIVTYQAKGVSIALGKTVYRNTILYDNYGDEIPGDSLYTTSSKLVGTIGADIVKGRVLIIDYPHQRMCLLDTLDDFWTSHTSFVVTKIVNSRMHIPITAGGKKYWFLFDTGASLFPINTDSGTWAKIVGGSTPKDSMWIDTWGAKALVYGARWNHDIYLGGMKLVKGEVWYSNFKPWLDIYRGAQVSGTVGNVFFLQDIIVIDFKNSRFGVAKGA